jgi:thiol-disulfide isomerase/thioredoxin
MRFAARIAMDPRTDSATSAPDAALAARTIGAGSWQMALAEAERTFADRMLENVLPRSMRGAARITDLSGAPSDIATLARGQVTVVAIWSRGCGPAVDALPRLGEVAQRLAAAGVRIIGVVEERQMSQGLRAFLDAKNVTIPTYLDAYGEVTSAFNSWGTPAYYVLDERGRIRFGATSDPDELLARAEAVRLSALAVAPAGGSSRFPSEPPPPGS